MLVQLKLEKGYEYGDAVLGGEIPDLHDKDLLDMVDPPEETEEDHAKPQVLGMSMLGEIQKQEKRIKVICGGSEVKADYKDIPDLERLVDESDDAVETACEVCKLSLWQ